MLSTSRNRNAGMQNGTLASNALDIYNQYTARGAEASDAVRERATVTFVDGTVAIRKDPVQAPVPAP